MRTAWRPWPVSSAEEGEVEFDPFDRLLLRRLKLTEAEALVVCEALKGVELGPEVAKLLWGNVKNALSADSFEFNSEIDGNGLTERLQRLNDGEAVALLRGVEWFWRDSTLPAPTRLQQIGLKS
jgi:hypothetical protein